MALIGNRSVLHKSPCRHLSGTIASGDRDNFSKHGMRRSAFQSLDAISAVPSGALSPIAWVLPKTAGGMAARYTADFSVTTTGAAVMGLPAAGEASFAISTEPATILPLDDTPQSVTGAAGFTILAPDVTGEVIANASGTASWSVSCNAPLLVASVTGSGEASIHVETSTPILGALAGMTGAASFGVSVAPASRYPTATTENPLMSAASSFAVSALSTSRLPANDTSPLRTGAAVIRIDGVLVPYAIGVMGGSTQDNTGMTPMTVAQAVWAAVASEFNYAGTMGKAINSAGTAGDPWMGEILDGMTAQDAMQVILSILAGKATGGGTGTITFRDLDDSKDAVVLTVDANGNRTAVQIS